MIATLPTISAQSASSPVPTQAYLSASPNPTGLNQEVTLEMWLGEINPTTLISGGGRWENFTVAITRPDGTSQILGPFTANTAAFYVTTITPNQLGNYKMTFSFPGQHVVGFNVFTQSIIDEYFGASTFTQTLTVQQQSASSLPQTPLPTNYWTRPINAQNQLWYTISGNWLAMGGDTFGAKSYNGTGDFNAYTLGPNSSHILWTKPLEAGGLMGGEFGGSATSNFYTGKSYQPNFTPPIIINGVLYYNAPASPFEGFYAVDLRTGITLWFQNTTASLQIGTGITMGQIYNYLTPNQEGGIPYLWSTSVNPWRMYDANTGNLILTINNVPAIPTAQSCSAFVEGPNGEFLAYILGTNWIALWNSSICLQTASTALTGNEWEWFLPPGATLDFSQGIQWNVTTPSYPGQYVDQVNSGIVLATAGSSIFVPVNSQIDIAYNATTGQQLWVQNRTYPSPSTAYNWYMGPMADGVYTTYDALNEQWYAFNTTNGNKLWTSVPDPNPWGSQSSGSSTIAYGILYGATVDGIRAFDLATGQLMWTFCGTNSGTNFPGFNTYPFISTPLTIADGKVYVATGVSHGAPLFRGARLYCVNATTGQLIWDISDFSHISHAPISDGILVVPNLYDNQIYAYGVGPSKTTVTAPDIGVTTATPVTIRGTVTDISTGASQQAVAANFPNGLPCVSDASMSQFMESVYMQQQMPTNVTGVPVTLSVLDSNGNTYTIGQTTSNAMGMYAFVWTPPITGNFTITATFAGSQSYYGSSADTFIYASAPTSASVVTPAPTQAAGSAPTIASTPSPAVQPPTSAAPTMTYVAIAAAVIIIAAVATAVVLRRRKS